MKQLAIPQLRVYMLVLKNFNMKYLLGILFCAITLPSCLSRHGYRKPVVRYPKDTLFWATDFFVKGCRNFLTNCPSSYKYQHICARNYNDDFKDFSNYCEMQYENCNSWRNWRVFKRERC